MEEQKWFGLSRLNLERIGYLIVFIMFAVPNIVPIQMPVVVGEKTKIFYNTIMSVPTGGSVMAIMGLRGTSFYTSTGPGDICFFKHMFQLIHEKQIKLVYWSINAEADMLTRLLFNSFIHNEGRDAGTTYGVDYVYLGWIPGDDMAYAGMIADFQKTAARDYQGTPLSELAITKDIKTARDFDLIYSSVGGEAAMRQFSIIGATQLLNAGGPGVVQMETYYQQGILKSFLFDIKGGAEYEAITGLYGWAQPRITATTLVHGFIVIVVLLIAAYRVKERWA